ncbi:MAG: hypothetical protein FH748_10115 [Balneolaceae bacterium]|nr:hypothetical protein [Balneolaceae bacterium]
MKSRKRSLSIRQQKTITEELIDSIKDYFDETFESDINSLKKLLNRYSEATETIPDISVFENNPMYEPFEKDFELKYNAFKQIIETNTELIEDKIKSPSVPINLKDSRPSFNDLDDLIGEINEKIISHNNKIDKKESEFKKLKAAFGI